jgi:hypothetical protein
MIRRTVLGLAALGSAGLVLGTSQAYGVEDPPGEIPPEEHFDVNAVQPEDLQPPPFSAQAACGSTVHSHTEIGAQPTYYEVRGATASFSYNATFYSRLETWLSFFFAHTPVAWARPGQVWTYGAYVNRRDGCTSYHNYGRAFDLSRVYATDPATGVMHKVFNARYDQWRNLTGTDLITTRKRYWATSASLHYHFKHVLTYFFNSQHHNHIHADNASSGGGNSTFSTGSRAQVQHVQACCTYIWSRSIAIDGIFGPQTNGAVTAVLQRLGLSGGLGNQANWLAFNRATLRFGSGTQSY